MNMDVQTLVITQCIADIVLCAAIVFLLVRIGKREVNHHGTGSDAIGKFTELLKESEDYSRRFLHDLEESRKALESTIRQAEAREMGIKSLLERAATQKGATGKDYSDAAELIKAGLPEREIIKRLGLSEGEVRLISDLVRARNEIA